MSVDRKLPNKVRYRGWEEYGLVVSTECTDSGVDDIFDRAHCPEAQWETEEAFV